MRNFLTIQEYDSEVGGGKPFCTRFARRRFEGTCSADNCMIWQAGATQNDVSAASDRNLGVDDFEGRL